MVRNFLKYLMVIGVVLTGFQCSAFVDEKDKEKDKKKEETTVITQDTVKIIIDKDISVGDTLVFDDFDEDDIDDNDDNSSIASSKSKKTFSESGTLETKPQQNDEFYYNNTSNKISDDQSEDENIEVVETFLETTIDMKVYPNPLSQNNGPVTVSHQLNDEVTITIFNLSGQLIQSLTTNDKSAQFYNMTAGIYLVYVSSSLQTESKRLMVR